jgi:3-dehydroquinate dehydratase / shikimate dehydrogenase
MVELRIDQMTDADELTAILKENSFPLIVTRRPLGEDIDFLSAAAEEADYVDIERTDPPGVITALTQIPRDSRPGLIASSHDFHGRPDRLYNILDELNTLPAGVTKIVWTARTVRDNLEAFEILQNKQKPTIALCMGEAGLISRVLAKRFGAFLTFASLDSDGGTAPGQIPIGDIKRLYRWDAINANTKVYGVVGKPIGHSMSPAIHNAAFEHVGHDGVYLPLLVESGYESFKAFMESFLNFKGLDLCGLSITIPHKEHALRYLQEKGAEIDPLALRIGAVNTIVIDGQKLRGFSTDYSAILETITHALEITQEDLAGRRVAVIGAGGTGRTAVAALAHCGATVVVYNRTRDRADALAAEFNGKTGKVVAAPIEKLCDSCCEIYVNATSVGMFPVVDQAPWGEMPPKLNGQTLVFDTVYNPPQTKLLREAAAAGAKTVGGIEMFVRQAAGQFLAWTAKPAPLNIMRNVIENRLGR